VSAEPDPRRVYRPLSDFCQWKEYAGLNIGAQCPECGHAVVVHIGTDHCPVCELLWQLTPQFRRQEQRRQGIR
jgi:hypothetical protein